jgi:hypothetical protein
METMDVMVRTRGSACDATLLYLVACYYIFEVWTNADFTRPWLMGVYLFTGKSLLDTLDAYARIHGLPADIALLSATTRRTLQSMCHTPIHHMLKTFRAWRAGAIDLDANLSQGSMHMVHTKPMEGYHGTIRTQGNGLSPTMEEWLVLVTQMVLKINVLMRLKENYAVRVGAPKNSAGAYHGKFPTLSMHPVPASLVDLIGIAGLCGPEEVKHGVRANGDVVPEQFQCEIKSYGMLHDHFKAGIRYGLDVNGPAIYRKLNPVATLQLQQRVRFPVKPKVTRPVHMNIVLDDAIATTPFEPKGAASCPIHVPDNKAQLDFALEQARVDAMCNHGL